MGDYQKSSSTKLPERKKARPLSRPRKTYIFQPTNSLAYNPRADHSLDKRPVAQDESRPDEVTKGENVSENHVTHEITPRHPLFAEIPDAGADPVVPDSDPDTRRDACLETPSRASPANLSVRIIEKSTDQQSSDDSFDGVRWKPARSPRRFARPLLSSPLKSGDLSAQKDVSTAPLINEITDCMFTKYGVAMAPTLSQTPHYTRTILDGVALHTEALPTITRSKSFDPLALPPGEPCAAQNTSRLNTWIDKFDDRPKAEISTVEASSPCAVKRVPPTIKAKYTDDDEAFSSSDDLFLAELNCDSFPSFLQIPHPQETVLTRVESDSTPKEENLLPTDESDPFSDDLDLAAIYSVLTQPSTTLSSFVAGSNIEDKSENRAEKAENGRLDTLNCEVRAVTPQADRILEESTPGSKISYSRADFSRYQVQAVLPNTYDVQNFPKKQLVLTVVDQQGASSKILVRGESAELEIRALDVVHVIHTSPGNPRLISDTHNLLIWHPDTLVSSTVVADQLDCPRKTVLNKRLSAPGLSSVTLFTGTIVHEIFQLCFITGKCTPEYMEKLVEIELQRQLLKIYTLGDVVDEVWLKINLHLPYVHKWFHAFYRKPPSQIPINKHQQNTKFSVAEILDIEERVVSPMFGIKGVADVTLRANLESNSSHSQCLLPMEIKTGQPYILHQAQAALYALLFKDRYNVDIASFLLVYTLKEGSTVKHDISVPDLKLLVNLRNRISVFLQAGHQGLPGLMRQQKCDRCFLQDSCMTYNYLTENGTAEESGLKEGVYEELTLHLEGKPHYKEFLAYWDFLLSKEEEFMSRFEKELWILTAKEREERQGKALGNLVISASKGSSATKDYVYTFRRKDSTCSISPFNGSQIAKYDRVIISDEAGHFALAQGYVRHIDSDSVTITSRRQIISTELKTDRFHRAGVLRASQVVAPSKTSDSAVVFRLDKDEMFYGMGVARFNVLNLFLAEGDHRRRELVVDLRPPAYSETSNFVLDEALTTENRFNECQVAAFDKVSKTGDYSLILGMPGTGKTTVIAYLIKMLVAAKKSVLLTSYTHSAVDNILVKVKEYDVNFLRIGVASRVHPLIKEHTPGSGHNNVHSYADFQRVYSQPLVVAATCLSVQDPAFSVRDRFDYCIVDEASQVSMPISLGPLALCDKFVLVGDHFQLAPLVSHPDTKVKAGLSQSLFQVLATAHPQSVVELKHQYRMCEDIMLISNKLVYKNRLVCGSEQVAQQVLGIPHSERLQSHLKRMTSLPWLEPVFQEHNKVVFFDHDLLPGYERSVGDNITNPTEVELVHQTVEALCLCGVAPSKIGIMTLYRSQLKLLLETFRHRAGLEILTADRFQGRDKECIIISMVRLNRDRRSGDLLKDWRRINVAVTRARSKLVVFGSVSTLSNAESVRDFVALAKNEGWVYELPELAMDTYSFEKAPATTTSKPKKTQRAAAVIGKHALVQNILADMNVSS